MSIARVGNKYISDTEPWKVAKTDMGRCATILNVSLQICADLAIALERSLRSPRRNCVGCWVSAFAPALTTGRASR